MSSLTLKHTEAELARKKSITGAVDQINKEVEQATKVGRFKADFPVDPSIFEEVSEHFLSQGFAVTIDKDPGYHIFDREGHPSVRMVVQW